VEEKELDGLDSRRFKKEIELSDVEATDAEQEQDGEVQEENSTVPWRELLSPRRRFEEERFDADESAMRE